MRDLGKTPYQKYLKGLFRLKKMCIRDSTNTGSQQKCQKRKIAHLRLIVELHLTFGHFGAVLHLVKQNCDLVGVQTHDFLVMELRHWH